MAGPFAERSIVLEFETGSPEEFLRFEPEAPPGERWLHRPDEFDDDLDREGVIDRYALPDSAEYEVSVVTVPPGESMRIGDVAGLNGRSGGGDLVELLGRDAVPEEWVGETVTLAEFLADRS
ncbi:hypothetical protein BRD00_01940 [Halobacteriales archaeon QS_8_69_26]|nr:MAG: hypothetical protein BRD00_01940 [Halobacteriales archaeon QS_8_69_26]